MVENILISQRGSHENGGTPSSDFCDEAKSDFSKSRFFPQVEEGREGENLRCNYGDFSAFVINVELSSCGKFSQKDLSIRMKRQKGILCRGRP